MLEVENVNEELSSTFIENDWILICLSFEAAEDAAWKVNSASESWFFSKKEENLGNIEDKIISQAHITIGNRWADIARELQRRSDNAVKNHWNASIKRRIRKFLAHKQQLDPANLPLTEDARFDFHPDEFESFLHVAGSGKDTEFDKLQNRGNLSLVRECK